MSMNQQPSTGQEAAPSAQEKPKTIGEIALDRGAQRREKISSFFTSAREKFSKGVDYALGSPEAIVHAGGRAWDKMTDATGRFLNRVDTVAVRLHEKAGQALDTAKHKTTGLAKRAAAWGLNTFAVPVENKITDICNLPAKVRDWRADRAEARAHAIEETGARDVAAIERQIEDLRVYLEEVKAKAQGARIAALEESARLKQGATARRAANDNRRLASQALGWLRRPAVAA